VATFEDLKRIDKLSWYVVQHYQHLLKPDELAALRGFHIQLKSTEVESLAHKGLLKRWAPETPESRAKMENGMAFLYDAIRDRVLQDHGTEVIINRCPHCNALTRTPRARQCPECFERW